MKRTPLSLLRFTLRTVPAAALLCLAPALHAAERFWITTTGGTFGTATNWSATDGGAGGATVPVVADVANFTLNNTYTVTFGAATALNAVDAENGNVTLDLAGFTCTLSSTNASFIGQVTGQTGRLTLTDGTLAVDTAGDKLNVGNFVGSTGFLTVTTGGILGTAAIRPDLSVGGVGTGTLSVNDNGRIIGAILSIGVNPGVTGTATITGPNAVVDLTGSTTIGSAGTGTLSVTNGGTLTGTSAQLGSTLGANGTATVSGIGSTWAISGTTLGNGGDGTLTISAGGLVTSSGNAIFGNGATGVGTATVTGAGSRWNLSNTQTIGSNGLGVMTVSSGGKVVSSSSAVLGSVAGSEGRATVTGAGSQWTLGGQLTVGSSGTGDLTVSGGGEVSTTSAILGSSASGIGEATITGAGSKLATTGVVTVASLGTGKLTVASDGELSVGTNLTVNDPAAGIGTLNLDGGSIYVAGNFINSSAFNFTDGLLQVAGNFQPGAAAAQLTLNGNYHGDLPMLELIGAGTTINVTGISVGTSRRGELRLRQGRTINTGNNQVSIASFAGSEGTLSVESGAQLLIPTAIIQVGGTGGNAGGTGTLNISSGGIVDASQVNLFRDGRINLDGGTLAVDTVPVLDGQFHWTGGALRFDAAFSLTSANVPKLLGLDAALNAGQALTSTANVTLQTPLTVDGGVLSASNLINQSRLELRSGFLGNVQNDGLLLGDGVISGNVTNNAAGRIRVDPGKSLTFLGTLAPNAGQVTLQGGSIEYAGNFTNSATGFISGRGTLFSGSITNNGSMAFSGGTTDLFGDALLNAGSRVATSGAGSVTTFWDDVLHNGTEIFTGAGCSTVFFGSQSGTGSYTGSGTIYFIGDLRPGNSPASISMAPQVVFSPSTEVLVEIGGLTPGTQHDKLNFTHAASPQVEWGGTLAVTLINGFTPAAGQSFDVLDFDPARDAGTFATLNLPTLPAGLAWDTSQLYTTGIISIVSSTGLTFAQWATASGIPGALPLGDHDHDGTANAVEFALGLFPNQPGTVAPIIDLHPYAGGDRLRARFTRPLDRTGVTLIVQASADLVTWTDVATSVNSAVFTGPGFVSENRAHPLPEPGLVEVRDILTTATTPRRTMRLRVTLAP